MRKRINKFSWIVLLFIVFSSCEDILEEDITGDLITIITPLDGDVIEGNTVQFLWNTLDGADDYNIQIYRGNAIIIDTLVDSAPYVQVLNSDLYEWRIKGINNAYETQFTFPESFEVVASEDLSNQTVVLNSPTDNLYTNDTTIIFTWSDLPAANSYTFELIRISSSGNTTVFLQEDIINTSIEVTETVFSEDSEYQWRVKAVNATSQTGVSSRTLFIDTVLPPTPSLLTPEFEEEFILADVITFSWAFGNDPGTIDSTITSFYDISSDAGFVNIVESGNLISTTFNYTFGAIGTYYWRVRGEDDAGNVGAYNLNGKLIVNE